MGYIAPVFGKVMKKEGLERNLVVLLFVMVLIVFSFADRDSKRLDRIYTTAQLLKQGSDAIALTASRIELKAAAN